MAYYDDKVDDLKRLFGAEEIVVGNSEMRADEVVYEIIDDVIVLLPAARRSGGDRTRGDLASAVQASFSSEWSTFDEILPEHLLEFEKYFDLVDKDALSDALVADLGCGIGRYSHFLAPWCRRLVLVDFSEAIFVARKNLAGNEDTIFVMGDVARLPWADDAIDFAFSLGVLHHLPTDALDAVRSLRRLSPRLLIYLYYSLDNRPRHYQVLLRAVTALRKGTTRVERASVRSALTTLIAYGVYAPLVRLGGLARSVGRENMVPLAEAYSGNSMERIRQDVYDRFFTPIEQRVSRRQIESLASDFSRIRVSDSPPFWHFECVR